MNSDKGLLLADLDQLAEIETNSIRRDFNALRRVISTWDISPMPPDYQPHHQSPRRTS